MIHLEPFGQQSVLRRDHVVVGVTRKSRAQAAAGLRRLAVADAIGQDDEILRRVEHLPGAEEPASELVRQKARARAPRAVQDENGVARDARSVALQLAYRAVMQLQFGQRLSAVEFEIADDEIALDRSRIIRRTRRVLRLRGG